MKSKRTHSELKDAEKGKAFSDLYKRNKYTVTGIVKKYAPMMPIHSYGCEDMEQIGYMALYDEIKEYNNRWTYSQQFSNPIIYKKVGKGLMRNGNIIRLPIRVQEILHKVILSGYSIDQDICNIEIKEVQEIADTIAEPIEAVRKSFSFYTDI